MSRATGFLLIGLAMLIFVPASIYNTRHPHYRGDAWDGRHIAARTAAIAGMLIIMGLAVIVFVTHKGG